ncbi:Rha family transcriptional regulator [Spirosoma panaciterrae]|uniref:Rha family transcriptional regulator n=1 Tax=Spirosoma panaciterrae TaxID=496058 RepID=UPI0003699BCB|nr:Rha family transcriptional regulator [Spirosoma panaciterrae]
METKPTSALIEVHVSGETLTVSSLDFAAGLGIHHKNLLSTIRTHQQAIESEFGRVAFETRKIEEKDSAFQTRNPGEEKRSTKPFTIAHLTEDQALFIGTLSRNSRRVVEFKATLVRSFSEARRLLREAAPITSVPSELFEQQEQRIAKLEHLLSRLIQAQQQAARSLLEAPRSDQQMPPETTRSKVQRIVNGYCRAKGVSQQDAWRLVYDRLYYLYRVSIRSYKRSDRESWLDVADRNGHMDKIYAIVSAELTYSEE